MPYNLRRRLSNSTSTTPRNFPIPCHGDRVRIFWHTLGRGYSGTLTSYDPIHATFLVVYDHTPTGFDDHRIWEALDLVPWRFEDVVIGNVAGMQVRDADEEEPVGHDWFQPGELGKAHPQFRADGAAMDLGSEQHGSEDEEILDQGNGDSGNDDHAYEGIDPDLCLSVHDEETGSVEIPHSTGNERETSVEPVEISMAERESRDVTPHEPEEQHEDQAQFSNTQESESNSDNSLKDSLYHPPLAPKQQPRKTILSKSVEQLHPPAERQVRVGQKRKFGNTQDSHSDSDDSMKDSLYHPPLAPKQQAPRRTASQTVEQLRLPAERQIRSGQKQQIGNTPESDSDSEDSLKDSLYYPPLASDRHTNRRKSSQPAQQQNPKTDQNVQYHENTEGNSSQPGKHQKQRQSSPMRSSPSRYEITSEDSLYYPPLAPQRQKPSRNSAQHEDQREAGSIRESKHGREYISRESLYNPPLVSSRPVLRRNSPQQVQKFHSKKMRKAQHGVRPPQRESDGMFDESLYKLPLAPKRKAITKTCSLHSHQYCSREEIEAQRGEHQPTDSEQGTQQGTQQEPQDISTDNLYHPPLASERQGTSRNSNQSRGALHFGEKRNSDPVQKSQFGSKHRFRESLYHLPLAPHREAARRNEPDPAKKRFPQPANLPASQDPRRQRRYANFSPQGFTRFSRVDHEHPTQKSNNLVQFYPQDTVHVNFPGELKPHRERWPSHHTNRHTFRASTRHHVLHSDVPSVEDRIKSITKTLRVAEGTSSDQERKD